MLQLDHQVKPSPHQMEHLGLQGLLVQRPLYMESPPGEAHSLCPLGKALPLLLGNPEKVFQIGKPESVETP